MINIRTVKFRGRTGGTRNLSQLERVEIYSPVNLQSAVITISTGMTQQLNTVVIHFDPGVRNEDVDPVDDGSITVPEIGELQIDNYEPIQLRDGSYEA